MIVYIACPMTLGHRIENQRNAIDMGYKLIKAGHTPIIPPLYDFFNLVHPDITYEDYMRIDFDYIRTSHALIRLPGESVGADKEVEFAHERAIQVFYDFDSFIRWTGYTKKGASMKSET